MLPPGVLNSYLKKYTPLPPVKFADVVCDVGLDKVDPAVSAVHKGIDDPGAFPLSVAVVLPDGLQISAPASGNGGAATLLVVSVWLFEVRPQVLVTVHVNV